MFIATSAAIVLVLSAVLALMLLAALLILFRSDRRAAASVSVTGAALAVAVVILQAGAPVIHHLPLSIWPAIATDYFLAMAHLLSKDSPYPFFWTPAWAYPLGAVTPLMAIGAVLAVAAGVVGRRVARRTVFASIVCGSAVLLLYVTAATHATMDAWGGVPV